MRAYPVIQVAPAVPHQRVPASAQLDEGGALTTPLSDAFRLMLTDAPRIIATQVAPNDMARCTQVTRDALEQILSKCKDQMVMSLQADDPLAPLMSR